MANTTTTNLSLQKPVIESIGYSDDRNLQAAHAANMDLLEKALAGIATAPTGASVPNVNGCRIIQLNPRVSVCSIASIAGYVKGMPFTIICQANSSTAFIDGKAKWKLSANWIPTADDSLTLVWDGTYFVELSRSAN